MAFNFKGIFAKAKKAPSGQGPQFEPGVAPAGESPKWAPFANPVDPVGPTQYVIPNHPAVVTPGFDDCGAHQSAQINYGLRAQPDLGGALNYAYENYGLPLVQPAGAWVVARTPFQPMGSKPLTVYPQATETSIGGLIPGQIISQPLLNPQGPDSGYDIYS